MKKQILGILFGTAFLIAGAISFIPNSEAKMQDILLTEDCWCLGDYCYMIPPVEL